VAPRRLRILFSAAFALALIAGAAAGVLAMRFLFHPAPASTATASTLDDLNLSPAQREQIKQIWEKVLEQSDELYKRTQALQDEHDNKIFKLLTPDQQKQYSQIYNQDRETYAKLRAQRDAALKKAVNDTRRLLSDSQRDKYDGILKSRLGRSAEPDAVWLSAPTATQPAKPANSQQDFQSQVRR
jgi:Spy/CpxP family protein refolding chaperone